MDAREDVAFLVGSRSREAILDALSDAPYRPTDLAETCGCARETAQRTLAGFCDRGWVEKCDGTYRLTPGGRMVYEQYTELVATVERADKLGDFLTNAPSVVTDAPTAVLDAVTVTTAVSGNPHAPLNRYLTVVGTDPVERFRGISPIVSPVFNDSAETVLGPTTEMELVVDEDVLETSKSEYTDALALAAKLDQFTLRLVDRVEFGLLLVDGHGMVAAYDDDGNMVALVDGDDPDVVAWVEDLYESVRDRSTVVDREAPGGEV